MDRKKILFVSAAGLCLSLTSCGGAFLSGTSGSQGGPTTSSSAKEDEILNVYRLYMENGGTMTYEEWLASIKGEPGKDGVTIRHGQGAPANELGNDGDSYIDLESWDYYLKVSGSWIKSGNLRGDKGDTGEKGDKGDDGVSVVSIEKTSSEGLSDTYTITYSDGTTSTFVVTNGEKGDQGIQGVPGENGHTPVVTVGENGNWFVDGEDTGVHAQGVQGPKGDKGDKGDDGVSVVSIEKTGSDGLLDTYTITYSDGSTSTFVVANGEKGDQGIQGVPGQDGHTPVITVGENGNWFVDGEDTGVHAQGIQGPKGEDGVSVVTIAKTSESGLADIYTITYSDGHTSTFVVMNGERGDQGIQGVPGQDGHSPVVTIGENGNWFVDGEDTGMHAQGVQGPKGDKGDTGNDGVSIVSIEKIGSEGLVDTYQITYSDGTSSTFTVTNGQKGDKGDTGEKGDKGDKGDPGTDGKDGTNGKSAYEIYKEAHPEYEGDEQQWLDDLVNGRLGTEEKKTYTVTFDLGYNDLSFTQKVEEGKKAKRPEDPVRKFYTFVDWVDEYKEHWVFNGYPITEDITLSAVWDCPYEYTVTFLNEDGSFLAEQKANNGDKLEYPLEETPRPGNPDPHYIYNFTGWKNAPETITGDITVIAQYEMTYISTTAYYYDYDGETLLATVPLAEGEAPHYDGETPTRERDKTNKLQFEFEKWEKAEETSSSVKFVAKYASCTDGLDIEDNSATYYHGTSTDVVIPSTWGGIKITKIAEKAFYNCSSVKSVTIPESVTSIGNNAFDGCSSLASVNIPGSVTSIGYSAFNGCSALKSVTIPNSVIWIGGNAFRGCSSLTSVTIPDSVTSIGESAFNGCSALLSVDIPDSVTSIRDNTFGGCSSLTSVSIPNSVTSIGHNAFGGCSSLTSVSILNSVTSIGDNVFDRCSSLTIYVQAEYAPKGWSSSWNGGRPVYYGCRRSETIDGITYALQEIDGDKVASVSSCDKSVENADILAAIGEYPVTSIGDYAFRGCSSLVSVTIPDSVTSLGNYIFEGCTLLNSVSIPSSVNTIAGTAFYGCEGLSEINFGSTKTEWIKISAEVTVSEKVTIRCTDGDIYDPSSITSIVSANIAIENDRVIVTYTVHYQVATFEEAALFNWRAGWQHNTNYDGKGWDWHEWGEGKENSFEFVDKSEGAMEIKMDVTDLDPAGYTGKISVGVITNISDPNYGHPKDAKIDGTDQSVEINGVTYTLHFNDSTFWNCVALIITNA